MSETQITETKVTRPAEGQPAQQAPAEAPTQEKADKAAVEQVANAKTDADFSKQFAALSKKQKEMYVREQALKEKEKLIAEIEADERLKEEDPYGYFKKKGLKLDTILQRAAKDGEEPTVEDKISAIEKRIDNYLQQKEKEKQEHEENQKRLSAESEQKAIDDHKKKIENYVKGDTDKFELINALGAFENVFDEIQRHFDEKGELLTIEEASLKIEEELYEQFKQLTSLKKFAGQKTTESDPTKAASTETRPSLTLNSTFTPTTPDPAPEGASEEDRMELAKKLLASSWKK